MKQRFLSKFDESKIFKGTIIPIKPAIGKKFIEWLKAKDEDGLFLNRIAFLSCDNTFEKFYREENGIDEPVERNKAFISDGCMEWAGLSRRDPCVSYVLIHSGVFAGVLHTWSTIGMTVLEGGVMERSLICKLIQEQIDLWEA